MAARYWVQGGSGNWSGSNNWSTSSGGGGGASVPTSADDVIFDVNSNTGTGIFTVTVPAGTSNCLSFTASGLDGTMTLAGSGTLNVFGSFSIPASNFTYTHSGALNFVSTSTGRTITTNGISVTAAITFNGTGGGWTLGSALTVSGTGSITLTAGTVNTGNFNISTPAFSITGTSTRALTLGTSTVTVTGAGATAWNATTVTGLTLSAASSTINMSSSSAKTFVGGGRTYGTLGQTGTGTLTISGSNTFNTLTNSVQPTTITFTAATTQTVTNFTVAGILGSLVTLSSSSTTNFILAKTGSGVIVSNYLSVSRSTASPSSTWYTLNSTDGGNNSGWTFAAPVARYWVGGSANWDASTTSRWSYNSGGTSGALVPTSSNSVYINASSGAGTITLTTAPSVLDLDFTGFTGTLTGSNAINIFGHLYFATGMTLSGFTGGLNFKAVGLNKKISFAGKTLAGTAGITFDGVGGGWTLQDTFNAGTNPITLTNGALYTNSQTVTAPSFTSTSGTTRILALSGSIIVLNGGVGTGWNIVSTGLTLSAGTSEIRMAGSAAQIFTGGSLTYHRLSHTTGFVLTISGNNIFDSIDNTTQPTTFTFTSGSSQTFNKFNVSGILGSLVTLNATSTSAYTLNKLGAGRVSRNYLNISYSTASPSATWYAGTTSTDGGNNTNWTFATPSFVGGVQTDPDGLEYEIAANTASTTKELVIDSTNLVLKLTRTNNLTADGVTLKCLYSRLKDLWLLDPNLTKLPFPMEPVTDEQFHLINSWNFDNAYNTDTKISVAGCLGTIDTYIIETSNNFNTSYVFPGAYVGGGGVASGAKVLQIISATQILLDKKNTSTFSSTTLNFWYDVDYTYNLIRDGGWAKKAGDNTTSEEEWLGVISLGSLGEEGLKKSLTLTSATTTGNAFVVADVTGVTAGSYITSTKLPYGAKVDYINTATNTIYSTINVTGTVVAGATISILPKDQPYYQIGTATTLPTNAILPGQVNQPIKIYGDATHGAFDNRSPDVANFFVREQAWIFAETSAADIGVSALTYQAYRFSLTNSSDALKITHEDTEISSDGITADSSPYSNMNITWYITDQVRNIGGTNYNFRVIIDADTTQPSSNPYAFGDATAEEIYEFVQWSLRRDATGISGGSEVTIDIDAGPTSTRVGKTTRQLVEFISDSLYTIYDSADGGVYIDHFRETDINRLVFSDNTNRQFPYVSFGTITFNQRFRNDLAAATYTLYYKQINENRLASNFLGNISSDTLTITTALDGVVAVGDSIVSTQGNTVPAGTYIESFLTGTGYAGTYKLNNAVTSNVATLSAPGGMITYRGTSLAYGTSKAIIVKAFSSDPSLDNTNEIKGNVSSGAASVTFDYDYDSNDQAVWLPYNWYYPGDEYRIGTSWRRVKTTAGSPAGSGYFSGTSWNSILDGLASYSEIISGPTVKLIAIGKTNAEYFNNEGEDFTIAKSNTNTFAIVAQEEKNYATYSAIVVGGISNSSNAKLAGTTLTVTAVSSGSLTTGLTLTGTGLAASTSINGLGTNSALGNAIAGSTSLTLYGPFTGVFAPGQIVTGTGIDSGTYLVAVTAIKDFNGNVISTGGGTGNYAPSIPISGNVVFTLSQATISDVNGVITSTSAGGPGRYSVSVSQLINPESTILAGV